jgi:hypothetical protein
VYDTTAKPFTFVRVVSYDQTSFQRAFQYTDDAGKKWTTNELTAVVTVKDGVVQGITWDDGCFKCKLDSEGCRKNDYWDGTPTDDSDKFETCATEQSKCDADSTECDLVVSRRSISCKRCYYLTHYSLSPISSSHSLLALTHCSLSPTAHSYPLPTLGRCTSYGRALI